MALVQRTFNQLSDLVVHEREPSEGYSREVILVAVSSTTAVTMGTVVFRIKGDTKGAYTLLTLNSQLVATNEFAVLFGDRYGCKTDGWNLLSTDTVANAVAFVRGGVILKDYLLKVKYTTANTPLTLTQFNNGLVHLLKEQGVIVEITV